MAAATEAVLACSDIVATELIVHVPHAVHTIITQAKTPHLPHRGMTRVILSCGKYTSPTTPVCTSSITFGLTRACILAKDKSVNVYTDSGYAFGMVHDFRALEEQ